MAVLNDQILGIVRGSTPNLTFAKRKKVNYFYPRQHVKSLPMDQGSVFRRVQFRFIGKLSHSIYHSPLLRIAWEKAQTENTWCVYDDIFKANYKAIRLNEPNTVPALFPGSGFKLINPYVTKLSGGYNVSTDGIGYMDNFNLIITDSVALIGIYLLSSPDSNENPAKLNSAPFSTQSIIPDLLSPFSITMNLTGDMKTNFHENSIIKAFFTLALIDKNKQPLSFSEIIPYNFYSKGL